MQRSQHPIGRRHRKCGPAAALAKQHRNRRRIQCHEFGQAARDFTGQPTLLGLRRQRGPRRIDHKHQRQSQARGQRHAAAGLAQRRRTDQSSDDPLLAEDHSRLSAESGQRQHHRRCFAAFGAR